MEAVTFIISDQNGPLGGVSAGFFDAHGSIVTLATSDINGEISIMLPSAIDLGVLYYARFYKLRVAFDNKYGFHVITGADNSFTIECRSLGLNPSIKPGWCNIQGHLKILDGSPLRVSFKILPDTDIGAIDTFVTAPWLDVESTTSGAVSFELTRDSWVYLKGLPIDGPKWCHVLDANSMDFVDFFCPIITSVVLEDNAPNELDIGVCLYLDITGTRSDGIMVPTPIEPEIYLDQYLVVTSTNPSRATVSLSGNTLSITGMVAGNTIIQISRRPDRGRGFGPQIRLPHSSEALLSFVVTVN